jgi:hypothetical protein
MDIRTFQIFATSIGVRPRAIVRDIDDAGDVVEILASKKVANSSLGCRRTAAQLA